MYAVLPELDQAGWTSDDFVRDMPVDYTLLLENLLDPGPTPLPPVIGTSVGNTVPHAYTRENTGSDTGLASSELCTSSVAQLHCCIKCMKPSRSAMPVGHSQHSNMSCTCQATPACMQMQNIASMHMPYMFTICTGHVQAQCEQYCKLCK